MLRPAWLEVTVADPSVAERDLRDPYLGASGSERGAQCQAGSVEDRDLRVSALFR